MITNYYIITLPPLLMPNANNLPLTEMCCTPIGALIANNYSVGMSNWEMLIKHVTFKFSVPYHMLGRGDRPFVREYPYNLDFASKCM